MTIDNSTQSTSAYQTSAYGGFSQQMQDFKGLGAALQSGDLSSAQAAMTTLQNDLQGTQTNGKTSPLLDPNSTLGKDFQNLQNALKSGDTKAAQAAFAPLKTDMRKTRGAHHHHKATNDGDSNNATAPTNTDSTSDTASSTETSSSLNVTA